MTFSALPTTIRGDAGERIVHDYIKSKGYFPYQQALNVPYPLDIVAYSQDAGQLALAEVKTYPRRYAYADTGIDLADWETYLAIAATHRLPFALLFVDKFEEALYGADIRRLEVSKTGKGPTGPKVYFDLSQMHLRKRLAESEVASIPDPPGHVFNWTRYKFTRRYFGDSPLQNLTDHD